MYTALWRYSAMALVISMSLFSNPLSTSSKAQSGVTNSPHKITFANANITSNPDESLESKIKEWIVTLSEQSGWENWKHAKWSVNTLGPGTHGWIVELTQGESTEGSKAKAIGYMIILASENGGYVLSEYGKGESPLFSEQTLSSALLWQGIVPAQSDSSIQLSQLSDQQSADAAKLAISYDRAITADIQAQRFYFDALHALWRIETSEGVYYLDANTGEELPIDQLPNMKQLTATYNQNKLVGKPETVLRSTFDPYEKLSWVTGQPLPIKQLTDLQDALHNNSRVTFVSDLYENTHHAPVPVLGYSKWQNNDETYLIIDQNGERYIPLTTALSLGLFYP